MPPQTANSKILDFVGTPSSFFVMYLVSALMSLIPFVGFAMAYNYGAKWMAENTRLHGRQLTFQSTLGETWVFLIVNILLVLVTLGIYVFWYVPKMYRFAYDHIHYADEVPSAAAPTAVPQNTSAPTATTPPSAPTPPTAPLVQ